LEGWGSSALYVTAVVQVYQRFQDDIFCGVSIYGEFSMANRIYDEHHEFDTAQKIGAFLSKIRQVAPKPCGGFAFTMSIHRD
jgi:hypothetical protein